MARPLRIEFPGALYHLTARGNAREAIYRDEADRAAFLDLYGEVAERCGWRCHAYCMMANHYHWVAETPDANLSRGMRQLNGVYTQRFNRRHGRVGHVFQGRFKAILVEREGYLKELARYVVLNPVRAGLVRRAQDWRWSSFRATAGLARVPAWLDVDWLLAQFGTTRATAQRNYRRFVAEGRRADPIWDALRDQIYLGSEDFAAHLKAGLPETSDLSEVPRAQRSAALSIAKIARSSRSDHEAMAQAYLSGGHTMKAIAEHFGVHYATVSRAVRRHGGVRRATGKNV